MLQSLPDMARKQRSKGRQEHPSGPLETVDDDWKKDLRVEMEKRGWTQKDLAREISSSQATITNIFKPGPQQTRYKREIEDLVGWNSAARTRELLERINRRGGQLTVEELQQVASLVELLASKR